eukprot:gb/GEZN01017531.1/.p1 GENE.gb/GEZN01017531.1/~~gb/GEZN01017531.1/.p1  ORF type:complete len:230 (+),score=52.72 gb/GEZN01017531.1/:39-728(+)
MDSVSPESDQKAATTSSPTTTSAAIAPAAASHPSLPAGWQAALDILMAMGFPRNAALRSLYETTKRATPPLSSPSPAIAANWLAEHMDDPEFDAPFVLPTAGSVAVEKEPRGEREEEPHKMVLVVNMSLQMGKGKIAAQCAHAAVDVVLSFPAEIKTWVGQGQAKVVLKAQDAAQLQQLASQARAARLPYSAIHDAGRTQVAAGSHTVLAIGPAPASDIDRLTGQLKLL